ncbi:MAG: hypothetical protein KIC37_07740 [Coriobacteriaceae bacterium]|nr:hypothetical protein [Coriobacteriaceae bacterium]
MAESINILAIAPEQKGALEVREQVNQIQYLMKNVLLKGTHYDTIKGCGPKPVLLQPGAEKIAYMFHFVPTYEVQREDFSNGHRAYDVTCKLTYRDEHGTERVAGYGMGECSTLESKYRYRNEWDNGQKHRVENPDIADVWNTVMKMAKKRAFVDAVKSTTAASDIFTQDIEDMPAYLFGQQPAAQPAVQPTPAPAPQPKKSGLTAATQEFMRDASQHYAKERGITANQAAHAIIDACGMPIDSDDYLQTVGDFVMGNPPAATAPAEVVYDEADDDGWENN